MMDGGDFWHVGRSSGHEGMLHHNTAALRFRPIAPKPVVGGASSGGISPEKATVLLSTAKRVKRKYVRVRKDDNSPRRRRSDGKGLNSVKETVKLTAGESPENSGGSRAEEGVVESWVTVEHVTDTSMEGVVGLGGCTDAERVKSLETDTCPAFVSDGSLSKVEWVNEAYRKMVAASHGGGGRRPEIVVRLVNRSTNNGTHCQFGGCTDGLLFFTCRVRVQYRGKNYYNNNNNNNNNNSNKVKMCWKVMPCDVWRLDSGGFAWRLDIKAALSLGL